MDAKTAVPAAAAALCLGATLLYAPTLAHPPIWDDHTFVFGQPFLMDCANLPRALSPRNFTAVLGERNSSRPVWQASVLLDTCVGGGAVPVYRTTSVFLHAVAALLVFALAWSLTGGLPAAVAAGALFAAHPAHAEAVNIITFRTDLLCLVFMLSALLLHRHGRSWAALACAALALLSKEMAVVLPALFLLVAFMPPPPAADAAPAPPAPVARRRTWAVAAGAAALLAAYLVFHIPRSGYVLPKEYDVFAAVKKRVDIPFSRARTQPQGSLFGLPDRQERPPWADLYRRPSDYARTLLRGAGSYLRLMAWPSALQGDYSPLTPPSWLDLGLWASCLAWAALLAAAWRVRREEPLFSFGAAWSFVALAPVSGLVPILNLLADRYVLVPSAGLCLAAGALFARLHARAGPARAGATAALALLTCLGAWRTARRNADFRSDRAFYEATLAADPGVARAQLALAAECANEDDRPCALRAYREALRLWPANLSASSSYMDLLVREGRYAEADAELARALAVAPEDPLLLLRAAYSERRAGRKAQALERLRACVRAAPAFWPAQESLALFLLEAGRAREALPVLETALERSRGSAPSVLYHLSIAAARSGRAAEAEGYRGRLKTLDPRLEALARAPRPKLLIPRI